MRSTDQRGRALLSADRRRILWATAVVRNPLVVCAVADHAWSIDYKDRESYAARFVDHIDWNAVATRYRAVDRH
jgi:superoxide dismutase